MTHKKDQPVDLEELERLGECPGPHEMFHGFPLDCRHCRVYFALPHLIEQARKVERLEKDVRRLRGELAELRMNRRLSAIQRVEAETVARLSRYDDSWVRGGVDIINRLRAQLAEVTEEREAARQAALSEGIRSGEIEAKLREVEAERESARAAVDALLDKIADLTEEW